MSAVIPERNIVNATPAVCKLMFALMIYGSFAASTIALKNKSKLSLIRCPSSSYIALITVSPLEVTLPAPIL